MYVPVNAHFTNLFEEANSMNQVPVSPGLSMNQVPVSPDLSMNQVPVYPGLSMNQVPVSPGLSMNSFMEFASSNKMA
jgi:hypothetical protein